MCKQRPCYRWTKPSATATTAMATTTITSTASRSVIDHDCSTRPASPNQQLSSARWRPARGSGSGLTTSGRIARSGECSARPGLFSDSGSIMDMLLFSMRILGCNGELRLPGTTGSRIHIAPASIAKQMCRARRVFCDYSHRCPISVTFLANT